MEIQDWASIATLVIVLSGFYAGLRREINGARDSVRAELKDDIGRVEERIARLDDRIVRLDDRVYALAVGLKPELEARGDNG